MLEFVFRGQLHPVQSVEDDMHVVLPKYLKILQNRIYVFPEKAIMI